jgi:hypothetical protein
MILGNYDKIFDLATQFHAGTVSTSNSPHSAPALPHPVSPAPGKIIDSRLPTVSADLSKATDIDPKTLTMKVSGFGEVPAIFNPETKQYSWTVNRPLRHPNCQVVISWKDLSGKMTPTPLNWSFQTQRTAAYLQSNP